MSAIFFLTLKQLILRRRYILLLLLAVPPILLSVIYLFVDSADRPELIEFHDFMTDDLIGKIVLPVSALLLATATIGDEIEDQTLVYLALKPISRWAIVVPKMAATVISVGLPVVTAGVLSSLLITDGDLGTSLITAAGLFVGTAAYAVVFTWGGLVSRNAIAFGFAYVLLWEGSITALFSGLRFLSIRQFGLGVIRGLDDVRLEDRIDLNFAPALIGAAVVVLLFSYLTERRLRLMDIP